MCTYEDCKEADRQYDTIKDWVNHEISYHRQPQHQIHHSSKASSDLPSPAQESKQSLSDNANALSLIDVWRDVCPICAKVEPSLGHVALHLQKFAIFALPNIIAPDESSASAYLGSNIASIDDQNLMSKSINSEEEDKDRLGKDKTGDHLKKSDPRPSENIAPNEKISKRDVQRSERGLQQVSRSIERGVRMDTFITGLESDNVRSHLEENKNDLPASMNNLSFYVQIDHVGPNQAQPTRLGTSGFWLPPTVETGYITENSTFYRWLDGNLTPIAAFEPVRNSCRDIYSAATVFTQNPDTPHLLVVPFDSRTRNAYENSGGWRPLTFIHKRIGQTRHTYSAVSANGDLQHIAAPGSPHWMPQLLPMVYDFQTGSPRIQAGLIGDLPLLIALAAFSAPPTALAGVLTNCLRRGTWRPHQFHWPSGRKFYLLKDSFV